MGPAPSRMVWPPKVKSIENIGEVKDTRGNPKCPRDGGRSIKLGGQLYYVFGDTFCFDKEGTFKGVANNSLAWIPNPKEPCKSKYLYEETKVPHFIPHTPEEETFEEEHKKQNWRIVTWCFGGAIEDEPKDCGKGWMWFEKTETHGGTAAKSYGVRVCRISQSDGKYLKAERVMPDERIFPEGSPQFGNIACVTHDGWIYCVGGIKLENFMARVRRGKDPTKRSNYQFWGKKGWVDDFKNRDELAPIMNTLGQGQIMKMPGHGPDGKSFMVLCCDKWCSGAIHMGWADKMTGPWDFKKLGDCPKQYGDNTKMRYAMFPHPWCFDWNKGELLYTWSDNGQPGGMVVAGKITFEVTAPPKEEKGKNVNNDGLKEGEETKHKEEAKKHEDEAKRHREEVKKHEEEVKKHREEAKRHDEEAKKHKEEEKKKQREKEGKREL